MNLLRPLTRPIIPALLAWGVICLLLFYGLNQFLMPWVAGRFARTSEVPGLTGLRMEKAREALVSRGLILMLDSASDFSVDIPAGRILSQFPDAGAKVKQGRRVWVRISKGRRALQVPVLRGMSLRQAEISLQEAGLRLGSEHYISGTDAPAGAVIGTRPEARTTVERDHVVDVEVSSGAVQSPDRMPSLIGLSLSQARNQIEALHLAMGKITLQTDSKSLPQTVLSQIPVSGAPLKGEPVDLVVSR